MYETHLKESEIALSVYFMISWQEISAQVIIVVPIQSHYWMWFEECWMPDRLNIEADYERCGGENKKPDSSQSAFSVVQYLADELILQLLSEQVAKRMLRGYRTCRWYRP